MGYGGLFAFLLSAALKCLLLTLHTPTMTEHSCEVCSPAGPAPVDMDQAAERTKACFRDWQAVCIQKPAGFLSWKESMTQQLSQQQSDDLLSSVTR